jgi:hypothetical protein
MLLSQQANHQPLAYHSYTKVHYSIRLNPIRG